MKSRPNTSSKNSIAKKRLGFSPMHKQKTELCKVNSQSDVPWKISEAALGFASARHAPIQLILEMSGQGQKVDKPASSGAQQGRDHTVSSDSFHTTRKTVNFCLHLPMKRAVSRTKSQVGNIQIESETVKYVKFGLGAGGGDLVIATELALHRTSLMAAFEPKILTSCSS